MITSIIVRRIAMVGFGAVLAMGLLAGLGNTAKAGGFSGGHDGHNGYSHSGYQHYGNHWSYSYPSYSYDYSYPSYGYSYSYSYSYPSYSYGYSYPSYYSNSFGYGHYGHYGHESGGHRR